MSKPSAIGFINSRAEKIAEKSAQSLRAGNAARGQGFAKIARAFRIVAKVRQITPLSRETQSLLKQAEDWVSAAWIHLNDEDSHKQNLGLGYAELAMLYAEMTEESANS